MPPLPPHSANEAKCEAPAILPGQMASKALTAEKKSRSYLLESSEWMTLNWVEEQHVPDLIDTLEDFCNETDCSGAQRKKAEVNGWTVRIVLRNRRWCP